MFSKIKNLMQQSAVYGMGTIAARAVAFLLLPYYSHQWTPSEYGIYVLFLILTGFLQPLYTHGTDIAFLRFSADAQDEQQKHDLGMILFHNFCIGIILGLPLVLFAPVITDLYVPDAGKTGIILTRLAAGILLLDTLSNQVFTFLRIKNQSLVFSLAKIGNVFINIGLNILFVGSLKLGVIGAFYAFIATSVLTLMFLLVFTVKHIKFNWSWEKIRPWLAFGLPNVPAMLFYIILEFSDRKWLEALVGADAVGVYSAGYRIGMLMNMVVQAFRYAWQPFFLQTAKDSDAKETFSRVMTYFIAFIGWIWLGGTLLLGDLLKIHIPGVGPIIDERYWAGLGVFPIIMLAHVFNGIYTNLMVGIYLEKKTKVIPLVIGAAALVNIIGNGLLIPIYGYWASAWLIVVSYVLMVVLMYLYISPRYPMKYEWDRIIRIVLTIVAAWGIGDMLGDVIDGTWVLWIVRLVIVLLLPLAWWNYVLMKSERDVISRRFFKQS